MMNSSYHNNNNNKSSKSRSRSNSMASSVNYHPSCNNNSRSSDKNSGVGLSDRCEALIRKRDKYGRTLLHCLTSTSFSSSPHSYKDNIKNQDEVKFYSRHYQQTQKLARMDWILKQILYNCEDGRSKNQRQQILRECLSCPDLESGYTPLHRAIYARDLRMILLLLYYASDFNFSERHQRTGSTMELTHLNYMNLLESGGLAGNSNHKDNTTTTATATTNYNNTNHLLYHLTQQCQENEGHTPLQLLGQLAMDSNTVLLSRIRQQSIAYIEKYQGKRNRFRHDSIASISYISNHSNSSSNVDDYEDSSSNGDSDDDSQHPHGDIFSFSQLPHSEQHDDDENDLYLNNNITFKCSSELASYGTEVFTFGSQDHPALGQFRSSSKLTDKMGSATTARNGPTHQARGAGVIMGRIEKFATFHRDNQNKYCDNQNNTQSNLSSSTKNKEQQKNQDIGNAVDISVASHHSLVVTTAGYLFSFGLGKGGKLGLGSEQTVLTPQRVEGLLTNRFVTTIAAAENHSLCTTLEGDVFAWGSNRFGQLGIVASNNHNHTNHDLRKTNGGGSSSSSSSSKTVFMYPTRVDDLRKHHITNLAAGDRHSVALSNHGEVFCFGDNKFGQCGSQSSTNVNQYHRVRRVDSLWSSNPRKIVIAVAASYKSTMVLVKSRKKYGQCTNSIYSWGNGAYSPTKVNFASSQSNNSHQQNAKKKKQTILVSKNVSSTDVVNPVKIACAKNHNVAISSDGKVYTWGLSSDAMARDESKNSNLTINNRPSSSSFKWYSPQLINGMLPENGGGNAVAISASEHHTAVVTSAGHLYTWGAANYGDKTLGHDGVKYQPCPRRVPGVFRAVGVATAREHTALLIGVNFPHFPKRIRDSEKNSTNLPRLVPSLHLMSQKATATYVDIFNVIPIFLVAERQHSQDLVEYCLRFIHHNLDTVLSVAKKRHLEPLLREGLAHLDQDAVQHEIDFDCSIFVPSKGSATIGRTQETNSKLNMKSHQHTLMNNLGESAIKIDGRNHHISSNYSAKSYDKKAHPSLRAVKLANENCDLSNLTELSFRYDLLNKAMRSIRKKLSLIATLEKQMENKNCETKIPQETNENTFSHEQLEKLARRPTLEADLAILQPVFDEVRSKIEHSNNVKKDETKFLAIKNFPIEGKSHSFEAKDSDKSIGNESKNLDSTKTFLCDICNVICPDEKSLSLHLNGRRHRNRERHIEAIEEKETARKLMQDKELFKCKEAPSGKNKLYLDDFKRKNEITELPQIYLSPPAKIANENNGTWQGTNKIDWANSIPRKSTPSPVQKMTSKPKICNFQEIMEQEERQKIRATKNDCLDLTKKKFPNTSSQYSKVIVSQSVTPLSSSNNCALSLSLDSLLSLSERKKAQGKITRKIPPSPKKLAWNVDNPIAPLNSLKNGRNICNPSVRKQATCTSTKESAPNIGRKISLSEIQQKEEELKAKAETQTGVDINGRWFVHRRDRAASIEEIQKLEEEIREKEILIKEQKEIEEMIKHENRKLEENKKKKAKRKKGKEKAGKRKQQGGKKQTTKSEKHANDVSDEVQQVKKVDGKGKHFGRKESFQNKSVLKGNLKLNASAGKQLELFQAKFLIQAVRSGNDVKPITKLK